MDATENHPNPIIDEERRRIGRDVVDHFVKPILREWLDDARTMLDALVAARLRPLQKRVDALEEASAAPDPQAPPPWITVRMEGGIARLVMVCEKCHGELARWLPSVTSIGADEVHHHATRHVPECPYLKEKRKEG